MQRDLTIDEAIEVIENFEPSDQDMIIEVLNRRRSERERQEIANNIKKATEAYSSNNVIRGTVQDLVREIEE